VPVLVNLDGFYLSFTREPVELPDAAAVREFLPAFEPRQPVFRASQPVAQGVAVLEGATYSYFRQQLHHAVEQAGQVHAEVAREFSERFGRRYSALETYRTDDADTVLVMAGSFATKGKAAVNRWRGAGQRVGLVRLRLVRPWPADELATALGGRRAVAVIDQNLSPGLGGIFVQEVAATLATLQNRPSVLRSFIGGLGGKDISQAEFDHVLCGARSSPSVTGPLRPEFLMTSDEWRQVRNRLETAGKSLVEAPA
jgi:pyruvate ferredoxin oxidoreductase alpha subunit